MNTQSHVVVKSRLYEGEFHNYLIGGNLCNSFALGEVGKGNDFFLLAAQPADDSSYPLLTANIFDSAGEHLFAIVRNKLVINPGHCSKIRGGMIGYEIHDRHDEMVFRVSTIFDDAAQKWLTTIEGRFYDRNGELIVEAKAGESDESIKATCKGAFGFDGRSFGLASYSDIEREFIGEALRSRGEIHEMVTGCHEGLRFYLDGKYMLAATLKGCEIIVRSGDFRSVNCTYEDCMFLWDDNALRLLELFRLLKNSS